MTTSMTEPRSVSLPVSSSPAERPASRLAQSITGRPYLSHSQLSCLRTCPRKFAYTYVERVEPAFVASSLLFGGAMHATFETYFRGLLEGETFGHERLLAEFDHAWQQQLELGGDRPVRFNQQETAESLHELAGRMISTFLDSPLARPKGRIVGVEEQLQVTLDPDLPDVLAKVDLVSVTDQALHVVDFKTSRSRWTEEKALQSAEQLVLYGVTVGRMSRSLGRPVELNFAVITKGKNPATQLVRVPTDPARVEVMKQSVSSCWQAMRSGNFYPAPSPAACTTCPYRDRCPVFAGKAVAGPAAGGR